MTSKELHELNDQELETYCGLLKTAYDLQYVLTGMVCGTQAEQLRNILWELVQEAKQ